MKGASTPLQRLQRPPREVRLDSVQPSSAGEQRKHLIGFQVKQVHPESLWSPLAFTVPSAHCGAPLPRSPQPPASPPTAGSHRNPPPALHWPQPWTGTILPVFYAGPTEVQGQPHRQEESSAWLWISKEALKVRRRIIIKKATSLSLEVV